MSLPTLVGVQANGVLTSEQVSATGDFILSQQGSDGALPWFSGGKWDPWDHVEAAMGLTLAGHLDAAAAGYRYCAATQSPDGSWPMERLGEEVVEAASDTNQCAYLATGIWHHRLVTGDGALLSELWPAVEAAIEFVLAQQQPTGQLAWAVDAERRADPVGLRTGSASVLHALLCAVRIAGEVGQDRPAWTQAAAGVRSALLHRPEVFADRDRYSMDWYYPILGGALRGAEADQQLARGWDTFVWPGQGVRCVSDRPWVTAAESSELVLTLDAVGRREDALRVLGDIQQMRDESTGGYWTGYVVDDDAVWPVEQTTWTAAAVLLALDAVTDTTPGAGIFRDIPGHFGSPGEE
ncbi:prenyltransferase [Dermacoccaceae bacterium W4C1]